MHIVFITGPPTHIVGGQTSNGRWRLSSSSVVVCTGLAVDSYLLPTSKSRDTNTRTKIQNPIRGQGQGHEPLKVENSAIFEGYLFPHL